MTDKKFYPEDSARFAAEIEKLKGQRVAVLGHQRPDGDCIGSTVAVVRVLKSLGIEAIGLNRDATPATLEAFVGETPMVLAADFTPDDHVAVSAVSYTHLTLPTKRIV